MKTHLITNKQKEKILELTNDWLSGRNIRQMMKWEDITLRNVQQVINSESIVWKKLKANWIDPSLSKRARIKDDETSILVEFNQTLTPEEFWETYQELIKWIKLDYKPIKYPKVKEGHLQIIDMADHHFWKYASKSETSNYYDLQIAEQRWWEWLRWVLKKSAWFEKDKFMLILWNDILHVDNAKRTTTAWTPQDTDWNFNDAVEVAMKCCIETIHELRKIAPVEVVYNPSNHDFVSGYILLAWVEQAFKWHKNVQFNRSIKHRKYSLYWNCLIWSTHWDWAKEGDLNSLMALEAKQYWAKAEHRLFVCHHLHHKIAKDHIWLSVEYMRSWSWTDGWHDRNGYVSKPAVDSLIIHKEQGNIARITHYL